MPELREGAFKGWNVVLITIDTVDPSRLGCYGGEKYVSPFIDSLAQHGILVKYAYTSTGNTAPAHASMLTSLMPQNHEVLYNGLKIADNTWNLPTHLRDIGYDTHGWTYAFFMDELRNFHRGFNYFFSASIDDSTIVNNLICFERFNEFITAEPLETPFFIWAHFKGGHAPRVPIARKYLERNGVPGNGLALPKPPEHHQWLPLRDDSPYLNLLRSHYDSQLSELDDALREFVQFFKERGWQQNTLFVIIGDHGESFDHGIIGEHGSSLYESTMRIPFIMWTEAGGLTPGIVADRLVATVDLAPTLLWLLGEQSISQKVSNGMNFFATSRHSFEGSTPGAYMHDAFMQQGASQAKKGRVFTLNQDLINKIKETSKGGVEYTYYQFSAATASFLKLIYAPFLYNGVYSRSEIVRIYDLMSDPGEQKNLYVSSAQDSLALHMFASLQKRRPFAGWTYFKVEETKAFPQVEHKAAPVPRSELDKKTFEKLKSLGYF